MTKSSPAQSRMRYERMLIERMSRRNLLGAGLTLAALATAISLPGRPTRLLAQEVIGTPEAAPVAREGFAATPFGLGIASGDPGPTGVVLWTRLAVSPLDGGGMPPLPFEVRWELANDERFGDIAQSGVAIASPALAHSVHVDVTGLEPAREYFYRFMVGNEVSPTGRTRTTPAPGAAVDNLRFAFTSCAHWEHGYFNAYRHIAAGDYDLVFALGDYIYEMGPGEYNVYSDDPPRRMTGADLDDLVAYRNRYALYRTDSDLQAAHAGAPWVVTWDDHEVLNDYAGLIPESDSQVPSFPDMVVAAYQAYYEHMPLRPSSMPQGPSLQLYRRLDWGDLVRFQVLDGRQYRSDQPCGEGVSVRCPAALDPSATMLGQEQERWVLAGMDSSTAAWNVLAQQTKMADLEQKPGEGELYWGDDWSGYPAARNRILRHVQSRNVPNFTVMTGDIHTSWANDLKADWSDPASPTLGAEYICTSITSEGAEENADFFAAFLPENPHVRFFDPRHGGYTGVELTPERWTASFFHVDDMRDPESGVSRIATWVSEAGNPGTQEG